MFKELQITTVSPLYALVDVNQPGETVKGLFQQGPVVGRITQGAGFLANGTLLYGDLWTGPGLLDQHGNEVVFGRYTKAVLPNGRAYPVCIALGGLQGYMRRVPGSKPGTVQLSREVPVNAVERWR